jgi:tetratricopeptide (TPR) repeat protein
MSGKTLLIGLLLCGLTVAVYWQLATYDFVALDDPLHITKNDKVRTGLSRETLVWAFTTDHACFWMPLTWLSFLLDHKLHGLNPGGYHLSNVCLHLANTLLLFWILGRMTAARYRSALVAALFALHPLHVKSVAWVSGRKDVLSTMFLVLTLWAYLRYVDRPTWINYLLVFLAFALSLMAKPAYVVLPFALLLIDYWPLERLAPLQGTQSGPPRVKNFPAVGIDRWTISRLLLEKVPFLALAVAASVVTFAAQRNCDAIKYVSQFPIPVRISNAVVSYTTYLWKMIWPTNLAVYYPHPGGSLAAWQIRASALFLLAVSVLVLRKARRYPYLAVGWLWFLGTLLPVIGLVQVGDQAMADRYTYVPLVGPFVMIVWGGSEFLGKWRRNEILAALSATLVLASLSMACRHQIQYWRNSVTLFEHTLKVTDNNSLIHNDLVNILALQGQFDQAAAHFSKAIQIQPIHLKARINLAVSLVHLGRIDEAVGHYVKALKQDPNHPGIHNNLGNALVMQGKIEEAMLHFRKAIEFDNDYAEPHNNLGVVLARQGRLDEAITHFSHALRLNPDYGQARINLEIALRQRKKQQGQ